MAAQMFYGNQFGKQMKIHEQLQNLNSKLRASSNMIIANNGWLDYEGPKLKSDQKKLQNSKNLLPLICFDAKPDLMKIQNQGTKERPSTTSMNFNKQQYKEMPKDQQQ